MRTIAAITALLIAAPGLARADTPGDECWTALPALVGLNEPVDTTGMTPSADPPANGPCAYLNWNNSRDAWWVFNAPVAGVLSVEFCDSEFDTSVVIYQGTCGALTRIACDDDSCNPAGPTYQSRITGLSVTGGPVYIRVGGYGNLSGTVRFNLTYETLGLARAWGNNDFGQTNIPATLGGARAIACGYRHTLVVRSDWTVLCTGDNSAGQCTAPTDLPPASRVSAGYGHSMALSISGGVSCWGSNMFGESTVPADLGTCTGIAAGQYHSIALQASGNVRCWGSNTFGQCTVPAGLGSAKAVAAGWRHSVAIAAATGAAWCWGSDSNGMSTVPGDLGAVRAIAAGPGHTMAVRTDGTVRCWGSNNWNQCTVPAGLGRAVAVAAGLDHSVALLATGEVRCWGFPAFGCCLVPSQVRFATAIAAGASFTGCVAVRDCDGNRVSDWLEVEGHDCNGNGFHDCWDVETGMIEDCNSNGVGDSCEKQSSVSQSRTANPIGFGVPATVTVESAPPAVSNVTLRLRGKGDFSSVLEYVRMRIGDLVDRQVLGGTGDCVADPVWQVVTLTPDEFNRGIAADGTWRASFVASSAVDGWLCPGGTWIEVDLAYTGANSADCDANAELDVCQIAAGTVPDANGNGVIDTCESPANSCPGDLDDDGSVAGADLGILLGAWGPTTPETARADLNADGTVNGADLGTLLGAWGPCTD